MSVVWLTGFACYRICIRIPCTHGRIGLLLWLASIAAMVVESVIKPNQPHTYRLFTRTHADIQTYLYYVLLGLIVALNILALYLASNILAPLMRLIEWPIGWLAGASFSLYLYHMPLIVLIVAMSPWPVSAWPTRLMVFVGVSLVILPRSEITERRKDLWRDGLLTIVNSLRLVPRT
jgi:peptidoglycan/LPS O-acetylase OafA/YrhL